MAEASAAKSQSSDVRAGQLPISGLLPANFLNHTPKKLEVRRVILFQLDFVSGGRSSASGSDLSGSMPGQSSVKYDSVYPIFRTAAQA